MSSSAGQWRWKSSRKDGQSNGNPCCSKYCDGNEKPWSMPTSVGGPSESLSTSHSAMPLRVALNVLNFHGERPATGSGAVVLIHNLALKGITPNFNFLGTQVAFPSLDELLVQTLAISAHVWGLEAEQDTFEGLAGLLEVLFINLEKDSTRHALHGDRLFGHVEEIVCDFEGIENIPSRSLTQF